METPTSDQPHPNESDASTTKEPEPTGAAEQADEPPAPPEGGLELPPHEQSDAARAAERPGSPQRVVVMALNGPEDGMLVVLTNGRGVIGRHEPDLAIELPRDQWLSRRHALLTYREGRWHLRDLESSNGTWLSDDRQLSENEEVVVELGQIFRVGHTDLMLSDDPQYLARASRDV